MDSYEIDIIELKEIPNGIEVFARAWKNDVQVAFGDDGTIEIERFKFINPPLSVPAQDGEVVVVIPEVLEDGEVITPEQIRKYTYNPELALQEMLGHAVKMTHKSADNMIMGKRGSTVTTIFTDDNSGHDGGCYYSNTGDNGQYTTAQTATTSSATNNTPSTASRLGVRYANSHWRIGRVMYGFDIGSSAVGTDTITAVTLSYVTSYVSEAHAETNPEVIICSANPASESNYVSGDYDAVGDSVAAPTSFGSVAISSISNGTYVDTILNSSGIAYAEADKAGVCTFGSRTTDDVTAKPWTEGSNEDNAVITNGQGYDAGTTDEPKLTITHVATSTFTPLVMWFS